jgi:hypothetical protein
MTRASNSISAARFVGGAALTREGLTKETLKERLKSVLQAPKNGAPLTLFLAEIEWFCSVFHLIKALFITTPLGHSFAL